MRKVLIPTDFSDNSWNAIRYALQFFKDQKCTFYILHTFTPVSYNVGYLVENPMPYGIEDVAHKNSENQIDRIIERIENEFSNSKHSFVKLSAFNMLVNEIIDTVEKHSIDLIIMGTKGATGAKEIFIGTHTMFTIKKVKCPVIAIPSGFEYEKPKEVLFPTDFNLSTSNKYLSLLKEICDQHSSRLNILNAYYGVALDDQQEEVKNYLDEYFKDETHVFHIADGMDVLEAVEDFQEKFKINLLVMIHNKHSFFENLLFKPVINQIVYHTNIPFLVIPSESRIS
ncbi:universal stress protein [Aquimarina sp. 2201CG5-10]|uniref:universal stress protein n=1 Tax=Aquimarina callyspongiae TaxID=3098150 RepID=UPI002AB572AE|nr:universal stress protein [Aquimarina sp. 2201CG5-10]MDY8134913.1 universal stress protein [Aquimarina sp. 2201CG5-10]